jgi:hypothetical protein
MDGNQSNQELQVLSRPLQQQHGAQATYIQRQNMSDSEMSLPQRSQDTFFRGGSHCTQ